MSASMEMENFNSHMPFRRLESRKHSTITHGLVGVIDESTNTVSFSIYTTPDFNLVIMHSMELRLITPQDGWFEQDPEEMMSAIYTCCNKACEQLPQHGYAISDIATIGITNQRETTIVWDTETGQPLYNALVWNDIRSNVIVDRILAKVPGANKNHFRNIVGLPVSPYFSALKITWLKENVPEVRKAYRDKRCKVGTVDSWIIYNFTNYSCACHFLYDFSLHTNKNTKNNYNSCFGEDAALHQVNTIIYIKNEKKKKIIQKWRKITR